VPVTLRFVVGSTLTLLGIGFAALLFIVLSTAWLSEKAHIHLADANSARELRKTATLLRESLLAGESSQRGYAMTGNEIYLAPYDNAKSQALGELAELRRLLASRSDRAALLTRLALVVDEKIAEQDQVIALKGTGQQANAMDVITSNRGKALMDEANVYLSALVFEAEDRVGKGVADQTSNTKWLRWSSIASALVIMLVVGGVIATVQRYTREIVLARDQVRGLNETLELRVEARTRELAHARDRAEVLLTEVNHRVSNSLALVGSLIRMQAREITEPSAKAALGETNARIQAIAEMHRQLFTTGNVGQVEVDKYLTALLAQFDAASSAQGSRITVTSNFDHVTLTTSDAIHLGIIITEWITNAVKYAYGDGSGEVRVRMKRIADAIEVVVEDDGRGRGDGKDIKGTGLGTRIVTTIAGLLQATVVYRDLNPGTEARLEFAADRASTPAASHAG
jgi:two-component sensor histidine kinase